VCGVSVASYSVLVLRSADTTTNITELYAGNRLLILHSEEAVALTGCNTTGPLPGEYATLWSVTDASKQNNTGPYV